MELHIRPATPTDAVALSQLICENAQTLLRPHYNDQQWSIFIRYYSTDVIAEKISTQSVFCAELNGQLLGTIALDNQFIVGFYTRLQHINQGIGKQLMNHIENFARVKGLKEIQLAASPEGLNFYYKNGWTKLKDFTIEHYGVGFQETLMSKKLTP